MFPIACLLLTQYYCIINQYYLNTSLLYRMNIINYIYPYMSNLKLYLPLRGIFKNFSFNSDPFTFSFGTRTLRELTDLFTESLLIEHCSGKLPAIQTVLDCHYIV